MVTLPLFNQGLTTGTRELTHAPWIAVVLWLTLFSGCWMMLWFHHERIKAVLISGAIGLVVTMVFVTMSAPDLALTQITVDVVTTVLLLMSLSLLPQLTPYESRRSRRWRDAALAIIGGLGIGWITWLILTRDHNSISWFFAQQSLPLGGGSNIVNVILVDFRGFDTFGEITVLGIAAIGALCLMDGMRVHGTTMTQGLTYRFNPSPLMFRITASWVLPLALVVSVYIFMRGHNYPGGGFIAGLITSMALIIQYIALGQDQAEQMLKAQSGRLYEIWIGSGLTIAGLTGIAAWFWARPFLTSAHVYVELPVLGKLHLASAASFDLGVYHRSRRYHATHFCIRGLSPLEYVWSCTSWGEIIMISLEFLLASAIGLLVATGIYLILRARTFPVVLGLAVLGYAVNLFLFAMGRLQVSSPAILTETTNITDPLPQALVLTAIVIGFATTAFIVQLALRSRYESGSDHVDAKEDISPTYDPREDEP